MRGMRRRLACLLVLFVLAPAGRAGAVPTVFIDPPLTELWTGSDCWVDVCVNDEVLGLTGYDLTIDYDETVVELLDVAEGALPQTAGESFFYWTTDPPPASAVIINGAVLGESVDGPGVLARLHFAGAVTGVSPIDFAAFELRDIENATIPAASDGGEIRVSDPPTIYLTPSLISVTQGQFFSIDVAINETLTDLTGYNLRVVLDSSIVQFVDAVEGALPPTGGDTYFFWTLQDDATMIINGAVLGSWVDGPGVLATVNLFALVPGTTDMELLSVELRDIENNALQAFDEGAVIVVEPGGSPVETGSWSRVKALFR